MRLLSLLFVLSIPFCGITRYGPFGNFSGNLALYTLFPLAGLLLVRGGFGFVFLAGPEARFIRICGAVFTLTCVLTVINGAFLSAAGHQVYGADPLAQAWLKGMAPLFILAVLVVATALAIELGAARLQCFIYAAFWLTLAYTALQILHGWGGNRLFEQLWPFLEGARDNFGLSYIERFGRINGPAMEPAEFVKLLLVFFLPWMLWPAQGPASGLKVALILGLAVASQSLLGVVLVAVLIGLYLLGARDHGLRKILVLTGLCIAGTYAYHMVSAENSDLYARLLSLEHDPSVLIRYHYNMAALDIIAQHALFGVGWSGELIHFPDRISAVHHLAEVRGDLATGNALTAKSLLLRLMMYMGLPLFALLLMGLVQMIWPPGSDPALRALRRTRFTVLMLGLSGLLDGGIVTSFFLWCAVGFCVGAQWRARVEDPAYAEALPGPPDVSTDRPRMTQTSAAS